MSDRVKEMSRQAVFRGVVPAAMAYEKNVRALRDARVLRATQVGDRAVQAQVNLGRRSVKEAAKLAREAVRAARANARVFSNTANQASAGLVRTARSTADVMVNAAHQILSNAGRTYSQAKAAHAATAATRDAAIDAVRVAVSENPGFAGFARGQLTGIHRQYVSDFMRTHDQLIRATHGLRRARMGMESAKRAGADAVFSAAGRGQGIRTAARLFGENITRDAVAGGRAAIRSAGMMADAEVDVARTMANLAITRAGKPTSGLRGAALKVGDFVRAVGGKATSVKNAAVSAVRRYTPFVSRSAAPASSGVIGKTGSFLGKSVGAIAKYGSGVGEISGFMNGVERFVVNHTKNVGIASKVLRGLTAAKSNALGFAIGTWIDAGLNAYDYFTDDTNRHGPGEITINGRTAKFHEPGILDAVASKKYVAEVAKGFGRALTLGFWGSGDDTVLDRWADGDANANNARLNEDIRLGRDPFTHKTLVDSEGHPLVTDPAKGDAVLQQANQQAVMERKFRSAGSQSFTEAGFRDYLGKLVSAKSAALQQVEANVADWENFSKTIRGGHQRDPEKYRASATANFTKRYDGYIAAAMSNPMAKTVADANRASAYRLYTGRDYDKDYALDGAKAGSVEGFAEFNKDWNDLDDLQRVSWDYESEKKAFDASAAAPVEEVK